MKENYDPSIEKHRELLQAAVFKEFPSEGEPGGRNQGVDFLQEHFSTIPFEELKEATINLEMDFGAPNREVVEKKISYLTDLSNLEKFQRCMPREFGYDVDLKSLIEKVRIGTNVGNDLIDYVQAKWNELDDPDNPHYEEMSHYAEEINKNFKAYNKESQPDLDASEDLEIVDLFDDLESLPEDVQALIASWDENSEMYSECNRLEEELKPFGYEFDWGLDGQPFNLRKIPAEHGAELDSIEGDVIVEYKDSEGTTVSTIYESNNEFYERLKTPAEGELRDFVIGKDQASHLLFKRSRNFKIIPSVKNVGRFQQLVQDGKSMDNEPSQHF